MNSPKFHIVFQLFPKIFSVKLDLFQYFSQHTQSMEQLTNLRDDNKYDFPPDKGLLVTEEPRTYT
jgi:hypothetical protein